MAAFNFPASPSNGDTYTLNSVTYQYDGTKWVRYSAAVGAQGDTGSTGAQGAQGHQGHQGLQGAQAHISTSAPSSGVSNGDLWWESDTGDLAIYYNDGSSSQWIDINTGPRGAQGGTGPTGAQGDTAVVGSVGGAGATGAVGAQGAAGAQGAQGNAGAQGAQGNAGAQGAQGSAGSATITNNANNRVITGGSGTNLNGESNFTWTGSSLQVTAGTGNQFPFNLRNDFTPNSQRADLLYAFNGTSNNVLRIGSINSNGGITLQSTRANDSSQKHKLLLNPDGGNIGIGDDSPDRELVVKNGSSNSSVKILASNAHTSQLLFSDTDAENVARIGVFHGSGQSTSNAMLFETGGNARMVISSSGKIAMAGETNPVAPLTLNGGDTGANTTYANAELLRIEGYGTSNSRSGIGFGRYNGGQNGYVPAAFIGAETGTWSGYTNCHLVFATRNTTGDDNATERLRIRNDGYILIPGTQAKSSETGLLDIYHTSSNSDIDDPHIRLWGPANNDCRIEFGSPSNTGEGGYIMYNDSDEGLYIGSRMATYSEVSICTGMNDGSPTANVRFSIDSSGRVTHPVQPGFEASYPDAYNTSNSPSNYITQWLRVHHNYGSHFNANTGFFTAPVNGRYLFTAHMTNVPHSGPHIAFGINGGAASGPSRGGTNYTELWHIGSDSGDGVNLTHIFDLSANDTVNVWIYGYTGTADDPRCYFAGYLLG